MELEKVSKNKQTKNGGPPPHVATGWPMGFRCMGKTGLRGKWFACDRSHVLLTLNEHPFRKHILQDINLLPSLNLHIVIFVLNQ